MPRHYTMDTRARLTATTHTRLLDATLEVLGEVGAEALTMQMVAERADVALRTVYNHFPSKEELVVVAYKRLARFTQDAVGVLSEDGSPRDRLARFVEAFYDALDEQRPGAAVLLGITGIPAFDRSLAEVRAWRRGELTTILRAAHRDGSLRIPLKQAVALAFHLTAWTTWTSFVDDAKLSPATAKELARATLDAALFSAADQSTIAG